MLTTRVASLATFTAAVVIFAAPTAATASVTDDFFTPRSGGTNPGVDFGLKTPAQPGKSSTGSGGSNSSGGSGSSSGVDSSNSGSQTNNGTSVCTGNIGASSGGGGLADRLADRLAACTADPAAPAAPAADAGPPDAATLAQQALGQLDLATPILKTSPEAPVKALVGLETWLWVPAGQWQRLQESVKVDDTEVTVTAQPAQTRWDMGESSKVCNSPGRAWRKGLGQSAETPCGYTYSRTSVREPNKKYEISAVLRYSISWTCEGECTEPGGNLGTLDSAPAGAALQVSERQSVVTLR